MIIFFSFFFVKIDLYYLLNYKLLISPINNVRKICFYLLKRMCSAYSFDDIIIGIYDNENLAKKAKVKYIDFTSKCDPFKNQAYHDVNLEEDIEIQEIKVDLTNDHDFCYILIERAEGFGQVSNHYVYFSTSFKKLNEQGIKFIKNKEKDSWPSYLMWDMVKFNDVRYKNHMICFDENRTYQKILNTELNY
ncbi:hypothetical protein QJ856_gp0766 [Tupanvirus deep ocean]|uniref:Uncharacterized protein n=2 Tax=Tupanvirus TaxID=2094720 RepID=A0AC62A876_9VIRU|nr:hypothetical protein QJ856_gp0766 [Tupanvirus deep ocean]QKU33986.1 hypothetical protein [Tupanvirus deep ocean]